MCVRVFIPSFLNYRRASLCNAIRSHFIGNIRTIFGIGSVAFKNTRKIDSSVITFGVVDWQMVFGQHNDDAAV